MLISGFTEMVVQLWNVKSSVNIVREIKCYLSKSKLIICEYNAFYFNEIAFIGFTLHEIKQGIVFLGTPGIYIISYITINYRKPPHTSSGFIFVLKHFSWAYTWGGGGGGWTYMYNVYTDDIWC
jgi:hypothetical protein